MQQRQLNSRQFSATRKSNSELTFGFFFVLLAVVSSTATLLAPRSPEPGFIAGILGLVVLTLVLLFLAKAVQPKPVNWITADVLFGAAFSLIHFAYFFYWIVGATSDSQVLWHLRGYSCPHTVCIGLAMYAAVLNCFLAGYYLPRTRRWFALINEQPPTKMVRNRWGKLGRLLVRIGGCGFCAFIAIVGPATFFGAYSGTNNISFLANICYQVGQVTLMAGVAVSMASKQRIIATKKRRTRLSLGVSYFDALLICGLCLAIGIHGDRSTLLYLIGAFVVAYSEYVKPIKPQTLVVAGLALIFFLGFILAFRAANREHNFNILENMNTALLNIGTSSVCGFVAISNTEEEGYNHGAMQVRQLAGVVPFGRRLFGIGDNIDNSSSQKLTLLIQGKVGKGVAGTGTSVFADYYFDFGLYGTMFLFFSMGLLSKYVQNRARMSRSILWQVILVTLVAFLAVCSRYSFTGGFIRTVLYSGIYTYCIFRALGVPTRYRKPVQQQMDPRMLPHYNYGGPTS